jgi:hypothetical protein
VASLVIFRHQIPYPQHLPLTQALTKLQRPSKSGGLDGIPALNIKGCSGIPITVLKFIFNFGLSQRISTTFWKKADFFSRFQNTKDCPSE